MARRNLASTVSETAAPLRLADVDIVAEVDVGEDTTRIEGAAVATLLDVAADTERLLDPEDISLELDHVADVLGALAEHAKSPTAGALFLAEHCLRRLATRVEALRPGARARARRFVITTAVREVLRDYIARGGDGSLVTGLPTPATRTLASPAAAHRPDQGQARDHDGHPWRQTRSRVSGISRISRVESASAMALAMAAGAGSVPPSPAPLTPSGFSGEGVTTWWTSKLGTSEARGSA